MTRKRYADWDPGCQAAYEQLNEIIASLGFKPEKLSAIKNKLERYMPPEVLFDMLKGSDGQNLLFALYAPEALKAYCGTRDTSVSRRLLFERDQEPIDFVMSVLTGYRKSGVVENGILDLMNKDSRSQYNPGGVGKKDTECPHCGVSFWAHSAGNGDSKYQNLEEWRDKPEEAPEHVVVDKSTGAPAPEHSGYHFCGGKHKIHLLNPEGVVNIELAQQLGGKSYEELQAEGRIRAIERNGEMQYFLVDEKLPVVEDLLASKESLKQVAPSLKRFDKNWVIEPSEGVFYRQCRHPIELLSPAQVAKKRIQFYHPYTSVEEGVRYIDIYKCPFCHASYRDREGITDKRKGEERVTGLKCQNCGQEFDTTDEAVAHVKGKDIKYDDSLDASLVGGGEEGGDDGEFTHQRTVKVEDDQLVKLEMEEFLRYLEGKIKEIGQKLNIRGSESAWEIVQDVIEGKTLKEITEKYLAPYYKLHYSQCLDCGYITPEKSNPSGVDAETYDKGLPINMQRCPRRHESPKHQVKAVQEVSGAQPGAQPGAAEEGLFGDMVDETAQAQEVAKEQLGQQMSEEETAKTIQDPYERQKYLGLNIMYVGRPTDAKQLAKCHQVTGWDYNLVPTNVSDMADGTYTGNVRITRQIYAPAARLIDKLRERLASNPQYHEPVLDKTGKEIDKHIIDLREHERFAWILKLLKKVTQKATGEETGEVKEGKRVKRFCKKGK